MKYTATVALTFLFLAMPSLSMAAVSSSASLSGNTATITVLSDASIPNALIDAELYDAGGNKVQQAFTLANVPNGATECAWNISALPGSYTLKVGVFNSNWSTLYQWNDSAAGLSGPLSGDDTFECANPPPPAFSSTASTTADTGGTASPFYTQVTADQDRSNILIDTEIYDELGNKVTQWWQTHDLNADTPLYCVQYALAPYGNVGETPLQNFDPRTYTIKVGLFSSDWSTLYSWNDNAGSFTTAYGDSSAETFLAQQTALALLQANNGCAGAQNGGQNGGGDTNGANDAPVAPPLSSQQAYQDTDFLFTIPTFSDPDGDALVYAAALENGGALPSWLLFNSTTRVFSGTGPHTGFDPLSIKVTATDPSSASASATFTLTVSELGHLRVIKHVINEDGGTNIAEDFQINVHGFTRNEFLSSAGHESGIVFDIVPGQYTADEDRNANGASAYTVSKTGDCEGSIAAGENKTCTITNTWTSEAPGTGTIEQDGLIVEPGAHVDFAGHGFGREEHVMVERDGEEVGAAFTNSGGGFTTGSMIMPTIPDIYMFTFTGEMSGIVGTAIIQVGNGGNGNGGGGPNPF